MADETKEQQDARVKEQIVIEAKIQAEIRKMAIERLKEKGEIPAEYK